MKFIILTSFLIVQGPTLDKMRWDFHLTIAPKDQSRIKPTHAHEYHLQWKRK